MISPQKILRRPETRAVSTPLMLVLAVAAVAIVLANLLTWPADLPERDMLRFDLARTAADSHDPAGYSEVYSDPNRQVSMADLVSWIADPDSAIGLDDARARLAAGEFTPIDAGRYRQNLPFTGVDGMWVRIGVEEFIVPGRYALNFEHIDLDITAYIPMSGGGFDVQRHSDREGRRNLFQTVQPIIILDTSVHAPGDVLVHIAASRVDRPIANLRIQLLDQHLAQQAARRTGAGLYVGYMMALLLFHAYVYRATGELVYLYYALFLATNVMIRGEQHYGFWWRLVPGADPVDQGVFILVYYLSITMGLLFVRGMIRSETIEQRALKIFDSMVDWLIIILGVIYGILIFTYPVFTVYNPFILVGGSLSLLLGMAYIAFAYHYKNPLAIYLLVGFLPMAATGIGGSVSASFGIWIKNPPFPVSGLSLADMFQTAVYALALSRRLRYLREEADRSRLQVIETQKENQRILTRDKQALEESVRLRTAQLLEAKDQADFANLAKTRFLANISHELRTPLTGIVGAAEMLGHISIDQDRLRHLILKESEHLLHLISDILDLSRIESGRIDLDYHEIHIESFLNRSLQALGLLIRKKGPEFSIDVEGPENGFFCDELRLRQILLNLCGNAYKFTERGFVKLQSYREDDAQVFEVIDSGRGIPADRMQAIFQSFEQADSSSTRRHGGSGLGLSISRLLVESMGGSLEAESESGKGSRFRLRLPLRPVSAAAKAGRPAAVSAPAPESASSQGTPAPPPPADAVRGAVRNEVAPRWTELPVLIVDDYPVNLDIAALHIRRLGGTSVTASTADAALASLEAREFSVILLDIHMPDMDGYELSRAIRVGSGPNRSKPIVAVTAGGFNEEIEQVRRAGMQDVLTKPFRSAELEAMLRLWGGRTAAPFSISLQALAEDFDDAESAERLRAGFLRQLEGDLRLLNDGVAGEGSPEELHRIAHSIRGAADNMRLGLLTAYARDFEVLLKPALGGEPGAEPGILEEARQRLAAAIARTLEQNPE
jgi:signal transduction histidine kinase/DNA-binding response OmpR family regulator